MTMPEIPVRDFMRRSLFNLRYLELSADPDAQQTLLEGGDPELVHLIPERMRTIGNRRGLPTFEFTALVNTFLMSLVHPWETFFNKALEDWSYPDAQVAWGFPDLQLTRNGSRLDARSLPLQEVIRIHRNGLAHGNIRLSPDQNNSIWLLDIWNLGHEKGVKGEVRKTSRLRPETMRTFLFAFVRMTEELMISDDKAAKARVHQFSTGQVAS